MKRLNLPKLLNEKGKKLTDGLVATAKKHGYDLHASGAPSLFYLRIADDPSLTLHQRWIAECVKRGVFFTNHHNHFMSYTITDDDRSRTRRLRRSEATPTELRGDALTFCIAGYIIGKRKIYLLQGRINDEAHSRSSTQR